MSDSLALWILRTPRVVVAASAVADERESGVLYYQVKRVTDTHPPLLLPLLLIGKLALLDKHARMQVHSGEVLNTQLFLRPERETCMACFLLRFFF